MKNLLFVLFALFTMTIQAQPHPPCNCFDFNDALPGGTSFLYNSNGPDFEAELLFSQPCYEDFTVTFDWDYGDGTTYSETVVHTTGGVTVDPSSAINHTYASPGVYTVCLTVTFYGWQTCIREICETVIIAPEDPCDYSPVYNISSHANMCSWVYSDASWTSLPFGARILEVNWDFGDGKTGTGNSVVHNFLTPGTYTVCMEVWTTNEIDCCVQEYCEELSVTDVCDPCTSMDDGSISVVSNADGYTFRETNLIDSYDFKFGYIWDFGDGEYAIGSSVTHTYEDPDFDVSLASLSIYYYNRTLGACCKRQITDMPGMGLLMNEEHLEIQQQGIEHPVKPTTNNNDHELTIMPNPSYGKFLIEVSSNQAIEDVSIFDQIGKLVYSDKNVGSWDKYNLDLSGFDAGFYIVVVNKDNARHRMVNKLMLY